MIMGLEQIANEVGKCTRCRLCSTRVNAVPGDGSPNAKIMLIGEAPGSNEDAQGKPFVGRAGRLLNEMLAKAGLRREDIYITNVVKCKPPGNRDPEPEEIGACSPYLDRQIEAIRPLILGGLGRYSSQYLMEKYGLEFPGITKAHGNAYKVDSLFGHFLIFPLYHPAAAIYNQKLRPELERDIAELARIAGIIKMQDI